MKISYLLSRWHVGMRTLKTGLAVALCLLVGYLLGYPQPLTACIAAILTMQTTQKDSFSSGGRRLLGTAVGGVIGLLLVGVHTLYPSTVLRIALATAGVVLSISICCSFHNQNAAPITAIVVLGMVLGGNEGSLFFSAMVQILETTAGVIIAVLVNCFVARPKEKEKPSEATQTKTIQEQPPCGLCEEGERQ